MNEMESDMATPPRILRLPLVRERTGLSRSSIYLRISEGRFPRPVSLGAAGRRLAGVRGHRVAEGKDRGQPAGRASRGRLAMTGAYLSFYSQDRPELSRGNGLERMCSCPSPDHEDSKPSCSVHVDTGKWYCHGCGEGGGVVKWLRLAPAACRVRKPCEQPGGSVWRRSPR